MPSTYRQDLSNAEVTSVVSPALPVSEVLDKGDDRMRTWIAGWLLGFASPHTRRAYAGDLELWTRWCAKHQLDPIEARRPHVDTWCRQQEAEDAAPATVTRRLAALASFYGWLTTEDLASRNPTAGVRRPEINRDDSPTIGLDRDQALALLAAADRDHPRTRARSRALIALLLLNGLRVGETVGIDLDDLGHERGHRTMRLTGKGGRTYTVPLAPITAAALDDYLAERTANEAELVPVQQADRRAAAPVFVTSTGRRLDPSTVFRLVRRLLRQAARVARTADRSPDVVHVLEEIAAKISPHSLRHTAITALLDAGVSLRDVQDFARHADPRTTRRYDRSRHNLDRHATYALAAYLADGDR